MFRDRLLQEMRKADRGATFVALLFIDLDHFKEVNDRVGQAIVDALYPGDARVLPALLSHADQAMYASKNAGRNRYSYSYFTRDLQEAALARQAIAADLREAIVQRQFEILCQPIVSLATHAVHKAEALLRWRHPTRACWGRPSSFLSPRATA